MRGLLLWGGWLLAAGYLVGATGSCRHRCCPGRNNACWVAGARRARCYCDSYCERTGDCCEDYRATCRHAGEWREGMAPAEPCAGGIPGLTCQPGPLLLVVGVCYYLLAPYFEQQRDVSGGASWAGFGAISRFSAFFHAECLAAPSAVRACRGGLWSAADGSAVVASLGVVSVRHEQDEPRHHLCRCFGNTGTGGVTKQGVWAWGGGTEPAHPGDPKLRQAPTAAPWTIAAVSPP